MFTPQPLASGQLPSSKGTLYTAPTKFRAKITNITFFNTDTGSLLVSLFINDGTTSRQRDSHTITTLQPYISIDKTAPLYLDAGYSIEGLAGSASKVNYFIYGELEQKG